MSVRLRVQFFRDKEPTCSIAVWACVVPPYKQYHISMSFNVHHSKHSWKKRTTGTKETCAQCTMNKVYLSLYSYLLCLLPAMLCLRFSIFFFVVLAPSFLYMNQWCVCHLWIVDDTWLEWTIIIPGNKRCNERNHNNVFRHVCIVVSSYIPVYYTHITYEVRIMHVCVIYVRSWVDRPHTGHGIDCPSNLSKL